MAERVSEDTSPSLFPCQQSSIATSSSTSISTLLFQRQESCSVCQKNLSRYSCPRCQTPYCSVECYRNHLSSGGGGGSKNHAGGNTLCSEEFYKDRISSILELEAKEQKDKTHKILQDHYQKLRQGEEGQELSEEDVLLSEQLYDLLELLEGQEEQQQDKDRFFTHEQILNLIPTALRADFQRDLNNGTIQKMILKEWFPWWRRQLYDGTQNSSSSTMTTPSAFADDDEDANQATQLKRNQPKDSSSLTTLDERLMKIPSFETISLRKTPSSRVLLYHLIDILYAYCWTMRLYHGLPNVLGGKDGNHDSSYSTSSPKMSDRQIVRTGEEDVVVEAVAILMNASAILGRDVRYTSLEEVLVASTSASTAALPNGCNTEWNLLVEDCAQIVTSHRLAGRALLEVNDLFKAAIRSLKQDDTKEPLSVENNKETILKLRRLRKKIEFFLSWSQYAKSEFGNSIGDEMMLWIQQWNIDESSRPDEVSFLDLEDLHIQDNVVPTQQERTTKSPLIVEVSSPH